MSAIAGGTTTIIAFVTQKRHELSLFPLLEEYHKKAAGVSSCDYGFHYILTNPTKEILRDELPILAQEKGITSVKLYMTYDPMKLNDRELLSIMMACRSLGMTTMIHAENSDMIALIIEGLEANGHTDPFFHAIARPRIAEDEASYRAISLSELVDAPILIVHMSSETAMNHVRNAQTRLLPVHAETCPHYLYLLSEELKGKPHDHFSGAKHVCSPPLRHHPQDLEALQDGQRYPQMALALNPNRLRLLGQHPAHEDLAVMPMERRHYQSRLPFHFPGDEGQRSAGARPVAQPGYAHHLHAFLPTLNGDKQPHALIESPSLLSRGGERRSCKRCCTR